MNNAFSFFPSTTPSKNPCKDLGHGMKPTNRTATLSYPTCQTTTKHARQRKKGDLNVSVTTTTSSQSGSSNVSRERYDIGLDIAMNTRPATQNLNLSKTYIFMCNSEFHSKLRKLNHEQYQIFNDIMLRKRLHPSKPINLFLTGGAGTGKTFTLLLLVQGLLRHYSRQFEDGESFPTGLLMAYTGKAAFNIGGTTIHSALHLPLLTNTPTSLSADKLDTLSTFYKNLSFVVFDEISLIGARTFALA